MTEALKRAFDSAELVFSYHARTKHRLDRYAAGPETLDWTEQPNPFLNRVETLVLDVRDAQSFATSHIESAQHIVDSEFEHLLAQTPRSKPILIYCYHGNASRLYAKILADFGFPQVYSLDGGYEAWRAAPGS